MANSDPAAAPLGTDAEAGGAPPTQAEIDLEARSRTLADPPAAEGRRGPVWLWVAGGGLFLLLALGIFITG